MSSLVVESHGRLVQHNTVGMMVTGDENQSCGMGYKNINLKSVFGVVNCRKTRLGLSVIFSALCFCLEGGERRVKGGRGEG